MAADKRLSAALTQIVPGWLKRTRAYRLLAAIGVVLDLLLYRLVEGAKLRFPGSGDVAAWDDPALQWDDPTVQWDAISERGDLPYHSRDRRIRRGRDEPTEVFAERLRDWWGDHKQRANAPALLRQVRAYYYPQTFEMQIVSPNGVRYRMATSGVITRDIVSFLPGDGRFDRWARIWLYYYNPVGFDFDGNWEDLGTWDDGGFWDFAMTLEDIDRAKTVPREWLAGHIGEATLVISHSGISREMSIF